MIPGTYPNPPSSKPWAIADGFCSKSAEFRPLGIYRKSSPTFWKVVWNAFAITFETFQGVFNLLLCSKQWGKCFCSVTVICSNAPAMFSLILATLWTLNSFCTLLICYFCDNILPAIWWQNFLGQFESASWVRSIERNVGEVSPRCRCLGVGSVFLYLDDIIEQWCFLTYLPVFEHT